VGVPHPAAMIHAVSATGLTIIDWGAREPFNRLYSDDAENAEETGYCIKKGTTNNQQQLFGRFDPAVSASPASS
jgi:hypothetical protein